VKNYYRIILGQKNKFAEEAYKGNFIGAGFIKDRDLTNHLSTNSRDFNKEFGLIYLEQNPNKSKVSARLACGMLGTIAKGIQIGDVVFCPDGKRNYYVGEVTGNYEYHKDEALPHRRTVSWFSKTISRDEMSQPLRNSAGSIGTVSNISKYVSELESLLSGNHPQLYIHSSSEPFNDEGESDKKRVDVWLNHYDLERVQSHCSGHSKGQDLLDVVKTVDAKMLYPVHTVHPDAYRKVSKNMTIVEEGVNYEI